MAEIPPLQSPWSRIALVRDDTSLFADETMDALDEHYAPDFAGKADAAEMAAALATKTDVPTVTGMIKPTKRGFYVLAGAGGNTPSTSFGVGSNGASVRGLVKLPVSTDRWRLRIRNFNTRDGDVYPGRVDFNGVWIGRAGNVDTGWDGGFAAPPVQALPAFSSADLSTEYVTSWVTDPASQVTKDRLIQIACGYIGQTPGMSIARGYAGIYYTVNQADASAQAASGRVAAEVSVFEIVLEYEARTTAPCVLVPGDSLTVGRRAAGDAGLGAATAWPIVWGHRTNALVTNIALSGSQFDLWSDPNAWKLSRWSGMQWDAVVSALGTNNIENGDTLAQMKTKFAAHLNALRTATGCWRIYGVTIPPRTFSGDNAGKQVIRAQWNAWIEGLPLGLSGVFRLDQPVINAASPNTLDPLVDSGDGTHMNRLGSARMAGVVPSISDALL